MKLVVCEDGHEYIERFRRFLLPLLTGLRDASGAAGPVELVGANDFAQALEASAGAAAVLLDLDFRRTPLERLVDENGRAPASADPVVRARLVESQGILILRQLRARGVACPAILFADLDDAGQAAYLARTLAPLSVAGSRLGVPEIAALVRAAVAP